MEQLSARLLLTAGILLLIAGGFSPFSKDGSIPAFSGRAHQPAVLLFLGHRGGGLDSVRHRSARSMRKCELHPIFHIE